MTLHLILKACMCEGVVEASGLLFLIHLLSGSWNEQARARLGNTVNAKRTPAVPSGIEGSCALYENEKRGFPFFLFPSKDIRVFPRGYREQESYSWWRKRTGEGFGSKLGQWLNA